MKLKIKNIEIKNVALLFFLVIIASIASTALAVETAPPSTWWGVVSIGANTSAETNGSVVEAFVKGSVVANVTVGQYASGYYLIDVPCNTGDTVTLRVYGIVANESNQTCVMAQKAGLNLSVNKSANGVTCRYAGGCTSGYCVDGYCCNEACVGANEACNVAGHEGTCTSTAAATTTTTTAPSGGGWVPATTTSTTTTTTTTVPVTTTTVPLPTVSETKTVETIAAGSTGTFAFTQPTLAVSEISVTTSSAVSSPSVTVSQSSAAPATVAIAAPNTVYGYLTVTKSNVQDADVSSVKVKFKVARSWITGNSIDESTITLMRYNNTWASLPTTKLSEDATYVYYEATSPGLSEFAITGKKAVTTTTQPSGAAGEFNWVLVAVAIVVIAMALVAAWKFKLIKF